MKLYNKLYECYHQQQHFCYPCSPFENHNAFSNRTSFHRQQFSFSFGPMKCYPNEYQKLSEAHVKYCDFFPFWIGGIRLKAWLSNNNGLFGIRQIDQTFTMFGIYSSAGLSFCNHPFGGLSTFFNALSMWLFLILIRIFTHYIKTITISNMGVLVWICGWTVCCWLFYVIQPGLRFIKTANKCVSH